MLNTCRFAAYIGAAACLISGVMAAPAYADAICKDDVRVLAQPRDGLTILEKYKDEFKKLSGASFNIDYLNENDRRAKSRADASTIGKYNVYYIDEANVALFAKSKWVLPLLDYYPKEYDYADFDPGRRKVATLRRRRLFRSADRRHRSDGLSHRSAREGRRSSRQRPSTSSRRR